MGKKTWHILYAWSLWKHWENGTGETDNTSKENCLTQCCKLSGSLSVAGSHFSPVLHGALFLSLPPPLQRQHKAMKDWRQSDVLWFISPESLRMLSVPHEGSDESRLSVRHLIISRRRASDAILWQWLTAACWLQCPLTMKNWLQLLIVTG